MHSTKVSWIHDVYEYKNIGKRGVIHINKTQKSSPLNVTPFSAVISTWVACLLPHDVLCVLTCCWGEKPIAKMVDVVHRTPLKLQMS